MSGVSGTLDEKPGTFTHSDFFQNCISSVILIYFFQYWENCKRDRRKRGQTEKRQTGENQTERGRMEEGHRGKREKRKWGRMKEGDKKNRL